MENDVTAAPSAAPAEALPDFVSMNTEDRAHYMKTGELPSERIAEPKPDATVAPEKAKPEDESGATPEVAVKETQTQEPDPKEHTNRRIRRLAAENKALVARLEALEKGKPTEQAQTVETKPAVVGVKPPKLADFATAEEWEDAKDEWHEKRRIESVREALREERDAAKTAETAAQAEAATDKLADDFVKRAAKHRKTLTTDTFVDDFNDVKEFLSERGRQKLGDAIMEIEDGPQIFTYFAENIEELEKLVAMSEGASLRELGRLEISEKIKGPAPKTRTAAKRIGSEIRGTNAVTDEDDAINQAALSGDMPTYNRLMNKREAAENRR